MAEAVHPNPVVAVMRIILVALLLSALAYFVRDFVEGFLVQLIALVWGVSVLDCAILVAAARFVTLEIGEKDILFRRGMLNVKTVLVPFDKITDTRYTQSLLERVFGVGTLEVETASESGVPIRMPAVRYEDIKGIMGDFANRRRGK